MSARTDLNTVLNTAFADNTSGAITPALLRAKMQNILDYIDGITPGATVLLDHTFTTASPFTLMPNGATSELAGGKLHLANNGGISFAFGDGNFTPGTDNIRITVFGVTIVKGICDIRISNDSTTAEAHSLVNGNNVFTITTTLGANGNAGVAWTTAHRHIYFQTTGTDDECTITRILIEKV